MVTSANDTTLRTRYQCHAGHYQFRRNLQDHLTSSLAHKCCHLHHALKPPGTVVAAGTFLAADGEPHAGSTGPDWHCAAAGQTSSCCYACSLHCAVWPACMADGSLGSLHEDMEVRRTRPGKAQHQMPPAASLPAMNRLKRSRTHTTLSKNAMNLPAMTAAPLQRE
jgi:hypothetical protein